MLTNFKVLQLLLVLIALVNAQSRPSSSYYPCDFDLPNIEDKLQYFPEICIKVYNERLTNVNLYEQYLAESRRFQEFYTKLNAYELRGKENVSELQTYPFEAIARMQIYSNEDLMACTESSNNISAYLQCLLEKRGRMIGMVPDI